MKITRRHALQTALLGSTAACANNPVMTPFKALRRKTTPLFVYGVASGDPQSTSVVIWTHVDVGTNDAVTVVWETAEDEAFTTMRAKGEALTGPSRDYTVKVVLTDLQPGETLYYRFRVDDNYSPVGRTRTLPVGGVDEARFAVVSCSNYPFGYFNVYDQIARRDDLNAIIHLGDYFYEYGPDGYGGETGAELGRAHAPAKEVVTLEDYRQRHAQYKSDPSSIAMLAAHPLIAIWDDHETTNDSWKGGAQNHQPETEGDWEARKRAALQAYYEWMPVRDPEPGRAREALLRSYEFGDLMSIAAIETRLMARDRQLEYNEIVPTLKTPEDIDNFRRNVLGDETRELLGQAQIDYLSDAFERTRGKPWRLIANQVIMAKVTAPDLSPHVSEEDIAALEAQWDQARAFIEFSKLGLPTNLDAWDGYPAARERLYGLLREKGNEGLIVVTGDTHTWWANDLVAENGEKMGVELGVHSVTSPSPYGSSFLGGKGADYALLTAKDNKDVRYISGENHGYIDLHVTKTEANAHYMAVDRIDAPDYQAFETVSFRLEKENGVSNFTGKKGLSFKEGFLF